MTGPTTTEPRYDYSIHYRNWHDESDEHASQMAAFHRDQLKQFLPGPTTSAILDIGCGMGFALLALRDLGFTSIRGIDTDEEQVKCCLRRGLNVERVDDTRAFLEAHPEQFDVVLMLDVLEHIPADAQISVMRSVFRAVKPSGRVILTVPNASSIIASRWQHIDHTHHTSFTEYSLSFVLKNAGFDRVIIPGEPPLGRPPLRLWKRSSRYWFRKWLVRWMWRQVLAAEIIDSPSSEGISLSLNLLAVAFKPAAPEAGQ